MEGDSASSYARYLAYPTSTSQLRSQIEAAFLDRSAKSHLVNNSRDLKKLNSSCN